MSDFAIKNLLEAEDVTGQEGREHRFTREALESTQIGVSYSVFPPDHRSVDGHKHEVQEEAYVVVEGSGRVRLDDEIHDLCKWDVVRVAPQVVRGFDAGPDGLTLIAIGGPKPEGGDGELISDRWPTD